MERRIEEEIAAAWGMEKNNKGREGGLPVQPRSETVTRRGTSITWSMM
jgi:hypothetical protein